MARKTPFSNSSKETKKRKKTRQGNGRGTKFSTRVGSKRFKKRYRGQGRKVSWTRESIVKWVLINKADEVVDTCEIASGVGISGATTYFRKRKQIDEESFKKLWKVMSQEQYHRQLELSNREGKQYQWWKDEESYLDVDAPITQSGEEE